MNIIKNEFIKLYKSKKILVLLIAAIITLLLMITIDLLDKYEAKDEPPISQADYYQANHEQFTYLLESGGHSEKQLQTTINKNELYYQNAIPYDGYKTGAYYLFEEVSSGLFIGLILPFAIFLIGIEAIIGEKNRHSLNFMLVSPLGRRKILGSKLITISIVILLVGVFYTLLDFSYAASQFGVSGWTDPVVITFLKPVLIPIWQALIIAIPGVVFTVIIFVILGLLFSVIFQSYSGAFMGFLALFLLRGFSSTYLDKVPFSEYMPFLNMHLNSFLFDNPATEIYGITFLFSLISSVFTAIILIYFMIKKINKRDIY